MRISLLFEDWMMTVLFHEYINNLFPFCLVLFFETKDGIEHTHSYELKEHTLTL